MRRIIVATVVAIVAAPAWPQDVEPTDTIIVTATRTETPLADAIFNLTWLAVLGRVHGRMREEALVAGLQWKGGGIYQAAAGDADVGLQQEVEAPDTTYVDDEAPLDG